MKIITETSVRDFGAWSGAVDTLNKIIDLDLCEQFDNIIEELYPNGLTETELNDLLWFDDELVLHEWLGVEEEEEEE